MSEILDMTGLERAALIAGLGGVLIRESVRGSLDYNVQDYISSNLPARYLTYNTGDFEGALLISIMTDIFLRVFSPEIPLNVRRGLSVASGSIAVIAAETIKMPVLSWVTDKDDISAGLIGVACYLGISLWQYRNTEAQKSI